MSKLGSMLLVLASLLLVPLAGRAEVEPAQKIAIPSYFYPGELWTQLNAAAPPVGLAIINPASGPGSASNPDYVAQVQESKAAGITVLGYVHTQYGDRNADTVKAEIDAYAAWYQVDGTFVDEASTACADQPYYAALYDYAKAKGGKAVVVLNPGTQTNECYMEVADIVLTFEGTSSAYRQDYTAPEWVAAYAPDRFWHLVYGTPTISEMEEVIRLSKQRRAGWVYVTPDVLPNPWDTLPPSAYWSAELKAVWSPLAHRVIYLPIVLRGSP